MNRETIIKHLRFANSLAKDSRESGHHPFGAVLIAPDQETVILRQTNVSVVRHAESELAVKASEKYDASYLWNCTLVSTVEPCAMCAGAIYWANIGRVVFGLSESTLKHITGESQMNPTMNLPAKQVFDAGQKAISLLGPVTELEDELLEPHRSFWR